MHSHNILSYGYPSVDVYRILLKSISSVKLDTNCMSLDSSFAQRARRDSNVGNSSGFNLKVKGGAVPSQRFRQTHSANSAWTSVPRRLPCGKGAGARNCSSVILEAASSIFAFDQALYLYSVRNFCFFLEPSLFGAFAWFF